MTQTFQDIQAQIADLQKKAAEMKASETAAALDDITSKMNAYGITIADLQQRIKPTKTKVAKSGSANPAPAKYRGPNGETWSGRGLMPRWLSGLVASGRTREEFAIA